MNNCLYLGEQDFYVAQGKRGPIIRTTQNGIMFVMFHADPQVCKFCDVAKPEFMQLPQVIQGCKFAMCNLSRAQNLVNNSFQTITRLDKVPLFVLYANGTPFMNYTGPQLLKHFAEFLQVALQRLSQQQTFGAGGAQGGVVKITNAVDDPEVTPHGIAYDYDYVSVSNPSVMGSVTCTEEGVCYLTQSDAYGSSEPTRPSNGLTQQRGPPQQPQQPPQQQYYPPQQQQAQRPYYPQGQPQQMGGQQFRPQQNGQGGMYYPQQQQQQQYYAPPQQQYAAPGLPYGGR